MTPCWTIHANTYSSGYASGVSTLFDLEGAKNKCIELGAISCKAVTCTSGGDCTVRGSSTLQSTSTPETTHRICIQTASPTKLPTLSPPDAFDCDAHSFPIQVVLPTSATFGVDSFIVAEMDLNTGEYNSLYLLDQIDARYVFLLCRGAHCVVEKRF